MAKKCSTQTLCDDPNCQVCLNRSFASHPKSKYWSAKNNISPRYVFAKTTKKCWFTCDLCRHDFPSSLDKVTDVVRPRWCPYCSNPPKRLCEEDNCQACFKKSFASHPQSANWSAKNILEPRNVFANNNNDFVFDCECGHEFLASPNHIFQGRWCPYCATPSRLLCKDPNCQQCLAKSFASHPKSVYWSVKNTVKPREVFQCSPKKYWFDCNVCGYDFEAMLSNITHKENPTWCTHCKKKTEMKLYTWLRESYPTLVIEREVSFPWCVNEETERLYRYDFYIRDFRLLIELDGRQHFEQVGNWEDPEIILSRDMLKMDRANIRGFTIVRLVQQDVLRDSLDWQAELTTNIKMHPFPTRVFICTNDEYKNHKQIDAKPLEPTPEQIQEGYAYLMSLLQSN